MQVLTLLVWWWGNPHLCGEVSPSMQATNMVWSHKSILFHSGLPLLCSPVWSPLLSFVIGIGPCNTIIQLLPEIINLHWSVMRIDLYITSCEAVVMSQIKSYLLVHHTALKRHNASSRSLIYVPKRWLCSRITPIDLKK